jgi:hypothetical protein
LHIDREILKAYPSLHAGKNFAPEILAPVPKPISPKSTSIMASNGAPEEVDLYGEQHDGDRLNNSDMNRGSRNPQVFDQI